MAAIPKKSDSRQGISPRPEVLAMPPSHHGAFDYLELEQLALDAGEILDFSVNSNPYGPSPKVSAALQQVPLYLYPDREVLALRRALSEHLSAALEQIEVGNGTAELIWLVALTFMRPGERVLIIGPTFGEYARAAALMGASVQIAFTRPEEDFRVDPDAVLRSLEAEQPQVVFICNPNNPTGAFTPPDVIGRWASLYPGTLFVVDEAYLNFVEDAGSTFDLGLENILVLRSMTKDYALAGLRLGYALGARPVIDVLARARPPWSVNAMAQAAGLAALNDPAHFQVSLSRLRQTKPALLAGLRDLGLQPFPSATQFFVTDVRDGKAFRSAMLERRILVRDCASFGLPAYVRIATRLPEENARLLDAIRLIRNAPFVS